MTIDLDRIIKYTKQGIINGYAPTKTHDHFVTETKHVPSDYTNPGDCIINNMITIRRSKALKQNGTITGNAFEILFLDAFLGFAEHYNLSDYIRSIILKKTICQYFPDFEKYNVDYDFVINHVWAFLLKTSLRERWKQPDRDIMVSNELYPSNKLISTILYFKEHLDDPKEKAIIMARNKEKMLYSDAKLLTVFENGEIIKLFNNILKGT